MSCPSRCGARLSKLLLSLSNPTTVFALVFGLSSGCATSTPTDAGPVESNPTAPVATPSSEDVASTPAPSATTSTAAGLPTSDIYLADIDLSVHPPIVGSLRNLTARDGYDNQPHFAPAMGKLLYTSIRDEQADIYALDLATNSHSVVHASAANEYSPTLMPNGQGISMIREQDGVQKLWHYSLTGEDRGPVLSDVVDVGYHAWLSPTEVALFVLDVEGGRHRLDLVTVPEGKRRTLAENIGRCLAPVPAGVYGEGALSFVAKDQPVLTEDGTPTWAILVYDRSAGTTIEIARTRPGSEDYAWMPDSSLLMVEKTALYRLRPGQGWELLASIGQPGLAEITRLAVSNDGRQLALVGAPQPTQ